MRIFKYFLFVCDFQRIELPKGAQILTVQAQNGDPKLWALVDENAASEVREFLTIGTGNSAPVTPRDTYIGTYQIHDGDLVFHVFEICK